MWNYAKRMEHITGLWPSKIIMLQRSMTHTLLLKIHVIFINNLLIWCLYVIHQSSAFLSNRRERYFCWYSRPRPWPRRVLDPPLCVEQSPKCVVKKSHLTEIIRKMVTWSSYIYICLLIKQKNLAILTIKGYLVIPLSSLNWFQNKPYQFWSG